MTKEFDYKKVQFDLECKVVNLNHEYSDYTAVEKYAIITALDEGELIDKYAEIVNDYFPYILLTIEQGAAIIDYHNNNNAKFRMRQLRSGHAFDISDGEFEEHHPELAVCEDIIEQIDMQDKIEKLRTAIGTLSTVQKRRLIKYFFDEKNYSQIGAEEGVSHTAIRLSIETTIRKLRKFF